MPEWGSRTFGRYRLVLITFAPLVVLLTLVLFFPPEGKEGAQWMQFIGRFHPLAVHFPIALILLVPVLELAGRYERFSYLRLSSSFVLGLATIAATSAGFLGWILARSGNYSSPLIKQHMWGGVTLAAVVWLCWMLRLQMGEHRPQKFYASALGAAVLVVSWTGYRGGQITQGEDHLTQYMPELLRHAIGLGEKPPTVEAAAGSFYLARVQPIFDDQCVNCHGPKKQKSNLRLDSFGWLMRGGKHGTAIKAGNAQASDLFRRITLSPDADDFMPKEKKRPLSPDQQKLIELWIASGASGTLPLEAIKDLPAGTPVAAPVEVSFPEVDVAKVAKEREATAKSVEELQSKYPNILGYESRNSAGLVLNASLLGGKFGDAELAAFAPVAGEITVADFSRTAITDNAAAAISAMKELRVLRLAQTGVSDGLLKSLSGLDQLQSLNLFATGVTPAALPLLEKFPNLQHFYAGQTSIRAGAAIPKSLEGKVVLEAAQ